MARGCAFPPSPSSPTIKLTTKIIHIHFSKPIHAYILQVIILANHMNGKDTHVRGMRILGPVE